MAYLDEQLQLELNHGYCNAIKQDTFDVIDPGELRFVKKRCDGAGQNIIDCRNDSLAEYLNDVNGLAFDDIKSNGLTPGALPRVIPIIPKRLYHIAPESIPYEVVGVSLKDIFEGTPLSKRLGVTQCGPLRVNSRVISGSPALAGKRVILFSTGKDSLIEELWSRQVTIEYYKKLSELGLYAATSADHSIFYGECPWAHAYNLKKSQCTFRDIQAAGVQSIPHVYWSQHENHLRRWVQWLEDNRDVRFIAVNCQLDQEKDNLNIRSGIEYLVSRLPYLKIVVEGPKRKLINELKPFAASLHIATKTPAQYALNHRRLELHAKQLTEIPNDPTPAHELIRHNYRVYTRWLALVFFRTSIVSERVSRARVGALTNSRGWSEVRLGTKPSQADAEA